MLRSGLRAGHSPDAEQRAHLGLAEMAFVDEQLIVDQHAFLASMLRLSGGIDPGAIPPMSA